MLKKYEDFKKQNEMKKFSNISKDSKKVTKQNEDKGKAPGPKYLDYEEEINKNILAQEQPSKGLAGDQTNIHDTKQPSNAKSTRVQPNDESEYNDKDHKPSTGIVNLDEDGEETNEKKKVRFSGKVAKFPKNTKAAKAYNFLENVKISKNKIWYILVEKQNNELQMVKYATKKGVNLSEFVSELKNFYISKYKGDQKMVKLLERIELGGDEEGNFTTIRNIPNLDIDGTKLIRKITEDLTDLLSVELDQKRRKK
ncbi:MAG: hypothetical protein SLAVMIC_00517 [uncultured marine phage]|uniref:Uncharacterized protein n=1 Tax=uncultured marine phage TaxID=707152 RepID=A0A8D9CFA9_9VIRU|nr:MAG: hypothetical protein SLAVMIC_00517 [uncultured marine phage]